MGKQYKLTVEKRETENKFELKSLRRNKKIPGVYYSYDSTNILFQIDESEIHNAIQSGANIFSVNVGGNDQNVIFKSVQYHPVTDKIIHIDLYGVDMKKAISIKIPIEFIGTAIGVQSEGGVLVTSLNELEISCLPSEIPDNIKVDVSEIELGSGLKVSDITLPEGVTAATSDEISVVSVTHMAVEEESVVDEDELLEGEDGEATDAEDTDSQSEAGSGDSDNSSNEGSDS